MKLVTLCKALADPTRVRLLRLLLSRELTVGEVAGALAASQPTVSRSLRILVEAGLVSTRREGSQTFCTAKARGQEAVFLEAARALLDQESGFKADENRAGRILARRRAETRAFFEAVAPDWGLLSRELLGDLDLAALVAGTVAGRRSVADLGCGPGELLALLRQGAETVIGVDNSARMLEAAARRLGDGPGVSLRLGELDHLPLRDREVEAAVLSMVLHHLPDPAAALTEAARALAPGGVLAVAELDSHEDEDLRGSHGDYRLGFSAADLEGLLAGAGFEVADIKRFPVNRGLAVLLFESVRNL